MTPEQQTALESLVDRQLTADEITAIDPHLSWDARNDVAIAEIISVGRKRVDSKQIYIGTVLSNLSPNGGALLDTLEQAALADSNVKWFMKNFEKNGMDVGNHETRLELLRYKGLMPAIAASIDALLLLAETDDPINFNKVSDALNVAEGRMTWSQ